MRYLATPSGPDVRAAMSAGLLGCMTTPAQGNVIPDGAMYACDNSRFGCDGKGRNWPGLDRWRDWLKRTITRYGADRCLWALAPDRPFDAVGTLADSLPELAFIRSLGVPAAFAAQNGSENGLIPWDAFDVLFLAGTTEWKIGPAAARLSEEAHARGKTVHMGRVNSRQRMQIADVYGCDSADGTILAFGPEKNLPQVLSWLDEIHTTPSLFTADPAA